MNNGWTDNINSTRVFDQIELAFNTLQKEIRQQFTLQLLFLSCKNQTINALPVVQMRVFNPLGLLPSFFNNWASEHRTMIYQLINNRKSFIIS